METQKKQSLVWVHRAMAVALCCLATVSVAAAGELSRELRGRQDKALVDVIVQYRVAPRQSHFDRVLKSHGGHMRRDLRGALKGAAFRVPANRLAALAKDPDVLYISPDRKLKPTVAATDFYDNAVIADYAWNLGLDGSGVGIAVIDSGVTNNVDFTDQSGNSRLVFSDNLSSSTGTDDMYGHGTHVAGIVAGNGAGSAGFSVTYHGIAPNANIINLRVLDENGAGADSSVIAAIQEAIALQSQYNIRVISLSLGRPVYESYTQDPLCQAVESAWQNGIVVVVAAGNMGRDNSFGENGYGTITAPGNDPYVITVGSMKPMGTNDRTDDVIATYSSKGPSLVDHVVKPDIVAPGNQVISDLASPTVTLATEFPQAVLQNPTGTGQSYLMLSGTSMATPVVSGTVALLLQQNPNLTPDQVKAILMKTAYKTFPTSTSYTDPDTGITYVDQYDIFTIGAGYLDVQAALMNTDVPPAAVGSAMSPSAGIDAQGNVYLVNANGSLWDNSVAWGTSSVWGASVFGAQLPQGTSVAWGASVAWGCSTSNAFSVIWGSSVAWGSFADASSESIAASRE